MKILSLMAILVIVLSFEGLAQEARGKGDFTPERKAEIISEKLSEKLGLNDIQRQKIHGLVLQDQKHKAEIRQENILRKKNFNSSMEAILSPDQRLLYQKMLEDKRKQRVARAKERKLEER